MQQIHDLIIIGAGVTGLTAAVCAGAAELDVLVIDRNPRPGGSLLKEEQINSYPALPQISGEELASMILDHCELFGVQFEQAEIDRIDEDGAIKSVWSGKREYTSTAVLIASGKSNRDFLTRLPVKSTYNGLIDAGYNCRTSAPMIYAAGNARCGALPGILNAAADGENSIKSFLEDIK